MESGVYCLRNPVVNSLPLSVKSSSSSSSSSSSLPFPISSHNLSFQSQESAKFCSNQCCAQKVMSRNKSLVVVSSAESSKCGFRSVGTPLEPRSSAGKFLSGILNNHPHIFHVAAAEQLEELAADRDGACARHEQSLSSTDSYLHGRIAEIKEHECQIAIEEVMYMLIVHKFSEINVPMVPRLSKCITKKRLDIWTLKDRELESIHRADVQELIREHLSTILGHRCKSEITDNWKTTKISRLQLGRIYAASVMYGYFLKSACLRYHLEMKLNLSHLNLLQSHGIQDQYAKSRPCSPESLAFSDYSAGSISSLCQIGSGRDNTGKLKSYMMGFDSETLQRCAKLKSQEAVNLIEKHSWALFGEDDESDAIDDNDMIVVTNSSLKRLVLEAVAFGSFLWDVEGYVGSFYRLKEN